MEKLYFYDDDDGVVLCYKIPGTLIDSSGVYYKNADGDLFNHTNYESDPNAYQTDYYNNSYASYFEDVIDNGYHSNPKKPVLFTVDGTPLTDPLYAYKGAYTLIGNTLNRVGICRDVMADVITAGKFTVLNTSQLVGNDVYAEYGGGSTTTMYISGNPETGSKLLSRNPDKYQIISLQGLSNFNYYTDIDSLPRFNGIYTPDEYSSDHYYSNANYLTNLVDTRASCFEPMLNRLRSGNFYPYSIDGKNEIYAPYILNRIGKCVAITHAFDVNMYSIINFGDGTPPVAIFTDPLPTGYHVSGNIAYDYWSGVYNDLDSRDYPPDVSPLNRPNFDSPEGYYNIQYNNSDPYIMRMRDYRATHKYANNGTYNITIESYAVYDSTGSDAGTDVIHTTNRYSVTITDAADQDIIYFKVPKEFDHLYINGVRCPVVEEADDYNVVGLDVTGFNWLLGKIVAGRRDAVLCKLPLLADTNYVKYQCRIEMSRTHYVRNTNTQSDDEFTTNYDPVVADMQYDAKSQLYYVDDLAGKSGVADFNCMRYREDPSEDSIEYEQDVNITISGVQGDNTVTTLGTYHAYEFPDGLILALDGNSFDTIDVVEHYRSWEPFFARRSIQVAEFENDYIRSTKDELQYVKTTRNYKNVYFLSDYTNMVNVLSVFNGDAIAPLTLWRSDTYYPKYTTPYVSNDSFISETPEAVAILTEACIGKTYDLRNAVPWKTFFPGCYCVDAPLELYK